MLAVWSVSAAPCGAGAPLFPLCPFTSPSFPPFLLFSFFHWLYLFFLSIPSLFTRIVPHPFQAGGRRRRPNLGLVCVLLCNLCYLYPLVNSGVFRGGWWGFKPPPMTGRTKIFSIELKNGLFSSLCYICSIVGTVAFSVFKIHIRWLQHCQHS